jgi:hypothetical protein
VDSRRACRELFTKPRTGPDQHHVTTGTAEIQQRLHIVGVRHFLNRQIVRPTANSQERIFTESDYPFGDLVFCFTHRAPDHPTDHSPAVHLVRSKNAWHWLVLLRASQKLS